MRKLVSTFCLALLAISFLPQNNAIALDTPTGFAATGNIGGTFTAGTVTLSWSSVTGADNGYAVQTVLNGVQIGDLVGVIGQSTNNLVVSGLQGGSEYSFKVRAISTSAVSSWSAAVTATPVTAPATPPKPTHVTSRLTATVNWSAPLSDGGSAITGYLITEANSGVTQTALSSARTVQFENLTAGEKVKFNVSAINSVLASGTVSTNSDETTLANVPGQVTGVSVAATSVADEIRITWTNPSNGGSDLTQTKVYLVSAGNDVQTATLANTSLTTHTFSGVSSGSYTAQVQSVNIIGSGSRSIAPTAVSIAGVVTAPHDRAQLGHRQERYTFCTSRASASRERKCTIRMTTPPRLNHSSRARSASLLCVAGKRLRTGSPVSSSSIVIAEGAAPSASDLGLANLTW